MKLFSLIYLYVYIHIQPKSISLSLSLSLSIYIFIYIGRSWRTNIFRKYFFVEGHVLSMNVFSAFHFWDRNLYQPPLLASVAQKDKFLSFLESCASRRVGQKNGATRNIRVLLREHRDLPLLYEMLPYGHDISINRSLCLLVSLSIYQSMYHAWWIMVHLDGS